MKLNSVIVHGGIEPDPSTGAIVPPIYQTATYVLEKIGSNKGFDYSRASNPTRQTLERSLAAIEGGNYGVCFSSGMAAIDAFTKLLSAGDHVICSDDVYGGTSRYFNTVLTRYGMRFTYVDTSQSEMVRQAIRPETKMLWIETPTNPLLKISDLREMAAISKQHNLYFGVDSTFATPIFSRPLEFGADVVVHSTTKYLSGHNQVIGGVVITNRKDIYDTLKFAQKSIGAVPSPFDCWLTLMGLKTLHLRMACHASNAAQVATFLENHSKVAAVFYPGLPSHPQHAVAKAQMSGFSGMLSFELINGSDAGIAVMNNVKLCKLAESLGATETMITHPATMTHAGVPPEVRRARGLSDGLVRLSVGIEDVADIIEDLEQSLNYV